MSLPKQLLYNNKIEASYARNYQSNIAPQNGQSYNLGETIIFNIPTARNLVMSGPDTVLKGSLNIKTGGAAEYANFDRAGVINIIQRLRIFHGSTLLSDIDNYGNLMNMMTTLQQSTDSVGGKLTITQGAGTGFGRNLFSNDADNTDATVDFCFPLMSILTLSNNYVPLYAMTGAPLRIEIQLVSSFNQFIVAAVAPIEAHSTASGVLTNVELVGNMMELNDTAMNIVNQSSGPMVQWVVNDYKNYAYNATLATSETQLSVPIPSKFNSLRSLFWSFRENSSGVTTYFPNESCSFKLLEYTLRVGSKTMPSKAPSTISEFFCELVRSIGSISDVNHETDIDITLYGDILSSSSTYFKPVAYTDGTQISKSFYVGIDLESYSNTDMSMVYNGYNTSTDDIFFQPKFDAQGSSTNIRIDTYALFDSLILFENGFATVQY